MAASERKRTAAMMDFDRHLEKLALIAGNAILILAIAVISISVSEPLQPVDAAAYPEGWRAPQQAQRATPAPDAPAWSHTWRDAQ
jgi:hypothetical protein